MLIGLGKNFYYNKHLKLAEFYYLIKASPQILTFTISIKASGYRQLGALPPTQRSNQKSVDELLQIVWEILALKAGRQLRSLSQEKDLLEGGFRNKFQGWWCWKQLNCMTVEPHQFSSVSIFDDHLPNKVELNSTRFRIPQPLVSQGLQRHFQLTNLHPTLLMSGSRHKKFRRVLSMALET